MIGIRIFSLLVAIGLSGELGAVGAPQPDPVPAATVVFVSDLHLGVGRDPADPSRWHATEDFRWHREFSDFLDCHAALAPKVELVVVGDLLELWQPLEDRCHHEPLGKDFGCTEEEALATVRRVLEQHRSVFESLSRFVLAGDHSIVVLPGNHDAALLFPAVRRALLEAFSDDARARVRVATEGFWLSPDGRVYAEHGHQIGADTNRMQGWPSDVFLEWDGRRYLRQPFGEQFVQEFYNAYEVQFPTIDNLSEEILGFQYARAASGLRGMVQAAGQILRFVTTQTSWNQAQQLLREGGLPKWDLEVLRPSLQSPKSRWEFLIASYPSDSTWRQTLSRFADESPDLGELSDAEILSVCDRRWATVRAEAATDVTLCPSTGQLGAIAASIRERVVSGAKAETLRMHLASVGEQLPEGQAGVPFEVFVFGHTHKIEQPYTPFPGSDPWRPTVVNDGAWQRTASPTDFCSVMKLRGLDEATALRVVQPEDFPPCYPYVVVVPDESGIAPEVRYWVQKPGEKGRVLGSCPRDLHPDCR